MKTIEFHEGWSVRHGMCGDVWLAEVEFFDLPTSRTGGRVQRYYATRGEHRRGFFPVLGSNLWVFGSREKADAKVAEFVARGCVLKVKK